MESSGGGLPIEQKLRSRLDALGPGLRAELLGILLLPGAERARRIGEYHQRSRTRGLAELLIDLEEDVALRGIVIDELRQLERGKGEPPRRRP
jgi:hypothetical protein